MPVELGSFDVIIGMDWLRRCHAVIVCDEKLFRIPYGNETLVFHGSRVNWHKRVRVKRASYFSPATEKYPPRKDEKLWKESNLGRINHRDVSCEVVSRGHCAGECASRIQRIGISRSRINFQGDDTQYASRSP
ncbi:putative reverse transcriptase domain-containing protein [Tanacetum coccineum]|uniref:Reverse transcriptase domain-containing protein n=1 Tax=Tanacetum coccineum TaxID=301880 RepID=A0ABQ5CSK4_9ASTR